MPISHVLRIISHPRLAGPSGLPGLSGRRSRTVATLTAVATVVGLGVGVPVIVSGNSAASSSSSASSSATLWLDASKPVSMRVDALLGAMTLEEKVGQMDQQ